MSDSIILDNGIEVQLRRSSRARRMTLRVPRDGGAAVLTLPLAVSLADGQSFVEEKSGWLSNAMARRPTRQQVVAGALLPVGGRLRSLVPASVNAPVLDAGKLLYPARKSPAPVVLAFLRMHALQLLRQSCDRYADSLNRSYRMIALRDTRSRWGSCSSDGRLMFSWRLAMAPPEVLDYVAAHEVAHLVHMDHSPRFWAQVELLDPDYRKHRTWLRLHGQELMAWKFRD